MDDSPTSHSSVRRSDSVATPPRVRATLEGHPGEAAPATPGGAGTWQGDLEGPALATLLRAAATGARLRYHDACGAQRVVVRRCWYDALARRLRVRFEPVDDPA